MNFRKTAMLTSFRQKPTISIRFNLLQNCPSVTTCEFTEGYIGAIRHPSSDNGHPRFDIQHSTSDIRDLTSDWSDIRDSTSDIWHPTSEIRHPTSDIRHPRFDIRHPGAWDQGTYEVRFERKQCGLFWFCLIILSFCIIANAYYSGMLLH